MALDLFEVLVFMVMTICEPENLSTCKPQINSKGKF